MMRRVCVFFSPFRVPRFPKVPIHMDSAVSGGPVHTNVCTWVGPMKTDNQFQAAGGRRHLQRLVGTLVAAHNDRLAAPPSTRNTRGLWH